MNKYKLRGKYLVTANFLLADEEMHPDRFNWLGTPKKRWP